MCNVGMLTIDRENDTKKEKMVHHGKERSLLGDTLLSQLLVSIHSRVFIQVVFDIIFIICH